MDDEILELLRERYASGSLIVFAGAGVSAGAGMPTWKQLAEKLRDSARRKGADPAALDEIQQYIDANQLINALSAAKLALGPQEFNTIIDRALDDRGREIPETAKAIAALKPRLKAVLTTNIDRFLERAFAGEWRAVERPTGDIAADSGYILKLHGTLRAWDTWVFSRDQYDSAIFGSPLLQDAFNALYRTHTLLFVGFGLADDNIDQTLARVRALSGGQPPMHFAIVPKGVPPFRRRLLEESGIRLIVYENQRGDHAEVAEILRSLEPSAAPPSPSPPPPLRGVTPVAQPAQGAGGASATERPASAGTGAERPIRVFFSYAPRDEELLAQLEAHLSPLRRQGLIAPWHSGKIGVGEDVERTTREQLEAADLILLLVSASYLASEQDDAQVSRAMERRAAGQATVVPIVLRPCDWEATRFAGLQAVPRVGRVVKPVTDWSNVDEAFLQVVRDLRAVVTHLLASRR